jgi:hypothetical protein
MFPNHVSATNFFYASSPTPPLSSSVSPFSLLPAITFHLLLNFYFPYEFHGVKKEEKKESLLLHMNHESAKTFASPLLLTAWLLKNIFHHPFP